MTDRWRLVNGKELYDIHADPGQKNDVSGKHPEVVQDSAGLRELVGGCLAAIRRVLRDRDRLGPGEPVEADLPRLARADPSPWNQTHILQGSEANGFWAVEVERAGEYEISLRRWPTEVDQPINAAIPGGRAIRATKARLAIGEIDLEKAVPRGGQGSGLSRATRARKDETADVAHRRGWRLARGLLCLCETRIVRVPSMQTRRQFLKATAASLLVTRMASSQAKDRPSERAPDPHGRPGLGRHPLARERQDRHARAGQTGGRGRPFRPVLRQSGLCPDTRGPADRPLPSADRRPRRHPNLRDHARGRGDPGRGPQAGRLRHRHASANGTTEPIIRTIPTAGASTSSSASAPGTGTTTSTRRSNTTASP